ncbi:hypothetical protein [Halarchaeum sp. P4]|uniref:hypothetical protein n=1 Tax=Halarchaeum sp. P4 TaxID=3421639 RepID=UPI003EBE3F5F
MAEDEPDSPDSIDLTQGRGHWTDPRDSTDSAKPVEEMTAEEIRERYPKRAEEIIEDLADVPDSTIAANRDEA